MRTALKIVRYGLKLLALALSTTFVICTLWASCCGTIWIDADVHDHADTVNERVIPDIVELRFVDLRCIIRAQKLVSIDEAREAIRGKTFDLEPPQQGLPGVLAWSVGWSAVRHHSIGRCWAVEMHALISGTIILLVAFMLIRARMQSWLRIRRGLCPQCGYSLAANVSGRCPECGAGIETPREWGN